MTAGQNSTAAPDFAAVEAALTVGQPVIICARKADDLLTPVAAYLKLAQADGHACLLESVEGGAWRGRYSAIGLDPDLIWQCRDGVVSEAWGDAIKARQFTPLDTDPMSALRTVIEQARCALPDGAPSIAAGLFGYVGYDMVRYLEGLPESAAPDPLGTPEACLIRPRTVVVFDALKQEIQVYCTIRRGTGTPRQAYDAAAARLKATLDILAGPDRKSVV